MTERLVSILPLVGHGDVVVMSGRRGIRSVVTLRGIRLATEGRVAGTNGLIGVRSLLGGDRAAVHATVLVAIGGTTRAAAGAEHPEQGTGQREDNSEPGCGVDVCAHGHLDAVGLCCCAERTFRDGKHDCRGEGGSESEKERDDRDHGGDATTPATADGEDTDQDLSAGGDEGDQVGDEHPLRNGLVDFHDLLGVSAESALGVGILQTEERKGVKVEFSLGLGARGDVLLAAGDVALTVTPETNVVVVGETRFILNGFDGTCEVVDSNRSDSSIAEGVFDLCCCF